MKNNKLTQSFRNAINGISTVLSNEQNIKIQAIIGFIIIISSFFLKISRIELMIIIFVSFWVIILEVINTAFEKLINKLHPDYDKEIGRIKDIIAGSVLLSAILSAIIGFMILLNPLLNFLSSLI